MFKSKCRMPQTGIITDMEIIMQNCSVGPDEASAVKSGSGPEVYGVDDERTDVDNQNLGELSGKAEIGIKGKRLSYYVSDIFCKF